MNTLIKEINITRKQLDDNSFDENEELKNEEQTKSSSFEKSLFSKSSMSSNQVNYQMNSVEFSTRFKKFICEKGNPETRRTKYEVLADSLGNTRPITFEECVRIQANVLTTYSCWVNPEEVVLNWIAENNKQNNSSVLGTGAVSKTISMKLLTLLCKVFRHIDGTLTGTSIEECWEGKRFNGHSARELRNSIAELGWLDITLFCETALQRRQGAEDIVGVLMVSMIGVLAEFADKVIVDIKSCKIPHITKKRKLKPGSVVSSNEVLYDIIGVFLDLNNVGDLPELETTDDTLTPFQEEFWNVIADVFIIQLKTHPNSYTKRERECSNAVWCCAELPPSFRFENTKESLDFPFNIEYQVCDYEPVREWSARLYPIYRDICSRADAVNQLHFKAQREAKAKQEEIVRKQALLELDSWIDAPEVKIKLEKVEPRPPKTVKNSKGTYKDNGAECKRWDALYAKTHEQNGKPKKSKK